MVKIYFETPKYFSRKLIKVIQLICCNFMPRQIMTGEFKGLTISKNIFGSAYTPKILGTYEEEISAIVKNRILDKYFPLFVDVGCAGGYYCEIARQLRPDIRIVGYDLNDSAIKYCKQIVPSGHFKSEKFDYKNYCDVDSPILFLFDIEGAEFDVFNKLTHLNPRHEFIIEVHSFGLNNNKSIDILNPGDFHINEIPYLTIKEARSKKRILRLLEFFLRHELREAKTRYIHIKPKF
tara:strand:- start:678 stop:1385 length:708 start_codon:yes stop_codon:yes gene_type:complete